MSYAFLRIYIHEILKKCCAPVHSSVICCCERSLQSRNQNQILNQKPEIKIVLMPMSLGLRNSPGYKYQFFPSRIAFYSCFRLRIFLSTKTFCGVVHKNPWCTAASSCTAISFFLLKLQSSAPVPRCGLGWQRIGREWKNLHKPIAGQEVVALYLALFFLFLFFGRGEKGERVLQITDSLISSDN